MKKIITILLVIVLVIGISTIGFTGCSTQQKTSKKTQQPQQQVVYKSRIIKLADVVNAKDSFNVAAEKFKEVVEKESGGKIKVKIYPNAELGDERSLIEGMQEGTIDMGVITDGPIANFLPEIAVFEMPYLFRTPQEAYYILDGPVGQKVLKDLEKVNLHGLAFAERGFRNITNSKRPIRTASDVKGLKIRVMENPLYVDTFKALGANAVPMAWGDCLTALKQGTIDGQENPVVVIYSFKLWESQKYMTMDRHTYAPATILMSLKLWKSLTPQEQKLFTEAADEARDAARKYDNDNEAAQLAVIKKHMQVIENPDLASFRKAVQPVYEKYGPKFGDLLTQIQDELKKYREGKGTQ